MKSIKNAGRKITIWNYWSLRLSNQKGCCSLIKLKSLAFLGEDAVGLTVITVLRENKKGSLLSKSYIAVENGSAKYIKKNKI